jgi:hypothetical protein
MYMDQWIDGIPSYFFLLSLLSLCCPFSPSLYPYTLCYHVTRHPRALYFASLHTYHMYIISRQSLINVPRSLRMNVSAEFNRNSSYNGDKFI